MFLYFVSLKLTWHQEHGLILHENICWFRCLIPKCGNVFDYLFYLLCLRCYKKVSTDFGRKTLSVGSKIYVMLCISLVSFVVLFDLIWFCWFWFSSIWYCFVWWVKIIFTIWICLWTKAWNLKFVRWAKARNLNPVREYSQSESGEGILTIWKSESDERILTIWMRWGNIHNLNPVSEYSQFCNKLKA